MKNIAALVLAVITTLAAAQAIAQDAVTTAPAASAPRPYNYKSPRLNRAQVDALLARPDEVVVVDVRRPDELTAIGGFPVYLSIQSKDLEQRLAYIPKDRQILTVSNHAARAGAAGDLLSAKGFKVAGAVGVQDYESEGGSLVKVAKPVRQ
jgi:rhodanese-related sulfurtransferase